MSGARLARRRCASSTDDLPFFFDNPHHVLAERARRVAVRIIAPDEDRISSGEPLSVGALHARARAIAQRLSTSGLLEAALPPSAGGMTFTRTEGVDIRAICLVREHLAWASGLTEFVFAMQGLGSYPIVLAGTPEQRQQFLAPVSDGTSLAAFAMTEPEAGSDVAAMAATARRDGDHYVLDGTKCFISNAGVAGHYIVFAKSAPGAGSKGISAFVVLPTDPGFEYVGPTPILADHPLGTIRFRALRLPATRRLGAEGEGFRIAMATLDTFRTTVGASAIGMARRALDEALAYTIKRQQFGQAIAEFQTTKVYLAEMATDLDAARLLVYRAAFLRDRGVERITLEASMGKMFATEAAQRIIDLSVQLHGAVGLLRGSAVERLYREVRALRIYEGTTEIQRVVIAGLIQGAERLRIAEEDHRVVPDRIGQPVDVPVVPMMKAAPTPPPIRKPADTMRLKAITPEEIARRAAALTQGHDPGETLKLPALGPDGVPMFGGEPTRAGGPREKK